MTITREEIRDDSIVREIDGKILIFAKEVPIQLHPQHTDRWTSNSSYTDVEGSLVEINFNDWPNHTMYLEVVGFTDAGTGFWDLYNITDSGIVTSSEISTTSTSSVRVRSSALGKLTGTKTFKLRHKIVGGGGGDLVNSVMSRVLFRADI